MKYFLIVLLSCIISSTQAQDSMSIKIPYYEITDYPSDYSSGSMITRMIDGLGFRYYWATDSLSREDLEYRPSPEARSCRETIEHIYDLSVVILNAALDQAHDRSVLESHREYSILRIETLTNLMKASQLFSGISAQTMESRMMQFKSGDKVVSYPIWHLINGPINDAVYHTGQIVSFRRTTDNPINPSISVFTGKLKK